MFSSLLGYLMVAVLVVGWVAFGLCFVLRRRGSGGGEVAKREPVAMVGIALQSVAFGAVWSVRRGSPTPVIAGHPSLDIAALLVEATLLALAVGSMWSSIRALGPQWALQARMLEEHALVTSGPFALVRHPIYAAMGAILVATGIVLSRWPAFAVALALFAVGTAIRVRAEERLLAATFGARFDEYRARVPAVLPWRLGA
jgi:protein-S-isoprenylcysteine O-methyltransferase Ste14